MSSNVRHPFQSALTIFYANVLSAFETAATFWRPLFREHEKQEVPAPTEQAPRSTKRAQKPRPLRQKPAVQKKPELAKPIKRSLKEEQELEREERAQKTERLRQLRLAKQAPIKNKSSSNGSGKEFGGHKG
jgi:hypothetical protein